MDTVRIGGASFSPDEQSVLFHNNKTGIFNVYTVGVAGGAPKQLTNSTKESTFAVSYFPNDTRFIYTYDKGGNENNHLYVKEADGTERDLTPGEKMKANFLGWSHDRKSFYYSTNERDPKFFDVFEMTVADMKPTMVFKNETGLRLRATSRTTSATSPSRSPATRPSTPTSISTTRSSKELKKITPHTGEVSFNAQTFDPQSKYLYFTTDEGGEFQYVKRYDLATGKSEVVEKEPWDIYGTYFSWNGKYRVTVVNQDARTVIKICDAATGKLVPLPKLPDGDITGVQHRAEREADGVLSQRRPLALEPLRLRLRHEEGDQADRQPQPPDRRSPTSSRPRTSATSPSTGWRFPPSSTSRTRPTRRVKCRPSCSSTAGRAGRRAEATRRRCSSSSTTATRSWT